jgi:hypothetical protein
MSEPRPRSARPDGAGAAPAPAPTPVRATVVGTGPTGIEAGADAVSVSLPEGTVCSLVADGRRWCVRIAGRSLSGRGTPRPVELSLLLFEPLDAPASPSGPPEGTLEMLVPTRQVETYRGFEPEAIEQAFEQAEPTQGAQLRSRAFFNQVDRGGRGRRGS